MVECESRKGMSEANIERVLIDTWWNVNRRDFNKYPPNSIRFNRYMVECEFLNLTDVTNADKVLIDTWWNVNQKPQAVIFIQSFVLIDTWWNVNVSPSERYAGCSPF
mgnify:CR=1 FL=1